MTDYAKLRQLAENATPGPWWCSYATHEVYSGEGSGDDLAVTDGSDRWADAEFIAAANPAMVLALLDELRDAQAKLQHAKADGWDEGKEAAFRSFLRPLKDNLTRDVEPNPYRKDAQ